MKPYKKFLSIVRPTRKSGYLKYALGLVFILASITATVAYPLVFRTIINELSEDNQQGIQLYLYLAIAGYGICFGLGNIFRECCNFLIYSPLSEAVNQLVYAAFSHTLRLPQAFMTKNKLGLNS